MSTIRELVFRVSMAGQSEFARDLKGIHDLIRKGANEEVVIARTVANAKRQVRDEESKHNAAVLRTQFAFEKARARDSVREADRAAKEGQRALERAEREKTRIAQREDRERRRADERAHNDSVRRMFEESRAFERHEREKTRIALRESNAREREAERSARQMQRIADRQARDQMFDQKRLWRGIGMGMTGGVFGVARAGVGAIGAISSATGFNTSWDVRDIMQEQLYAQKLMRSAAIEARGSGMAISFDEKGGLAKVRATALRYGISQRDLLGAIDAASEKGSGADAVMNLDRIAQQATAMGTDTTTIAKMRAQIKMSSEVAGKKLDDPQIDKMMAAMHFLGKTGVFRAEDVAAQSESLVSSFVKGGGDLETGWNRYMSFANEARKSVGSGSMARTAIMAVQDAIAKKESKINALGIKTRDADGSQRDFLEVVMDTIQKTGGRGETFNKIFEPSRSGRAIATLMTASQSAGGGVAGRAAMEKLLKGDVGTVAEMNADAATRLDTPATKIAQATEKIRQAFATTLEPALTKFAEKAPAIAEAIAKIAQFALDNPKLAAAGALAAGGAGGAARPLLGAGLRFAGDIIANKLTGHGMPGVQSVFIAGAAPGVMGAGPGVGGGGGGVGGGAGMPGGILGASLAGGPLAMMGGVAAVTVGFAALAGVLRDAYIESDHFKNKMRELGDIRFNNQMSNEVAFKNGRTGIATSIADDLSGIGSSELGAKHGNVGKGYFGQGGGKYVGKLQQTREDVAGVSAVESAMAKALGTASGAIQPIDIRGDNGATPLAKMLGIGGGPKLVGPAAEGTKDIAAAHAAEASKNQLEASKMLLQAAKDLAEGARAQKSLPPGGPISPFKIAR